MNKMIKTLILIFLFFHTKEETIIDLEDLIEGDGYTIEDNQIIFTSPGTYNIAGQSNLALVISKSITLNLLGVQIATEEELPPIDICSGCQVTINVKGVNSSFTDNASNAKNAVIYMQSGSSLTITSETTNTCLFLTPVKDKGIYGEGSNNLIVNNGVTIQYDDNNYATFIEIDGNIEVNHGNIGFKNNVQNACPSIKASGSITIKKGMCGLHSIQAENNIKIGERGGSYSNTNVQIRTGDEGMKAKDIEIYSSELTIISDKDSISSNGNILIEDSFVYLYAGSTGLRSSPFKKVGKLQIRNSNIIAFGTNCEGEIMTNQGTMTFVGDIIPGKEIYIAQYGVASEGINPDKEYSYYFRTSPSFQSSVNDDIHLLIDGEVVPSEEHSCNVISDDDSNAGNSGNTGNAGKNKKNSAKYLNVSKLYHLLFIYLILF